MNLTDLTVLLQKIVEDAVKEERERCAMICENLALYFEEPCSWDRRSMDILIEKANTARVLADRIRFSSYVNDLRQEFTEKNKN